MGIEALLLISAVMVAFAFIFGEMRHETGLREGQKIGTELEYERWMRLHDKNIIRNVQDLKADTFIVNYNNQLAHPDTTIEQINTHLTYLLADAIRDRLIDDWKNDQDSYVCRTKHQDLDGADNPCTVYSAKMKLVLVPFDWDETNENAGGNHND